MLPKLGFRFEGPSLSFSGSSGNPLCYVMFAGFHALFMHQDGLFMDFSPGSDRPAASGALSRWHTPVPPGSGDGSWREERRTDHAVPLAERWFHICSRCFGT